MNVPRGENAQGSHWPKNPMRRISNAVERRPHQSITTQATATTIAQYSSGVLLPHVGALTVGQTLEHVVRGHQRQTGLAAEIVQRDLPAQAPLATKIALYRIIQEALNNAWRHAAGATPTVTVTGSDDRLDIEVADAGPGFDPAVAEGSETHLGLVSMRERAESLGGQFHIESAPGRGTRAITTLPLGNTRRSCI